MLTEDYLIDSLMCLVIAKLCKFPKEADMHEGEVRERERGRSQGEVSVGKVIEGGRSHDATLIKNFFWPCVENDDLALER